jgi:hypothetical protein
MSSDAAAAADAFVDALADVLQASNSSAGASPELRSRLAAARASAEKLLTTKQYSDAVFKAFRVAGWDWT